MKITILLLFLVGLRAEALTHNSLSLGMGYYSENVLSEITKSASGSRSFLGTTHLPLLMSYDFRMYAGTGYSFFLSPRLSYTLLPRSESGDSAKITNLQFLIPFGWNIYNSSWDFSVGPGIHRRTIKGRGGLTQINNGNGTSTLALPGGVTTSQVMILALNTSYNIRQHSVGLDLISEGLFSEKRNMSLMLSYAYRFQFGPSSGESDFGSSSDF